MTPSLRVFVFTQIAAWAQLFKRAQIARRYYEKILIERPNDAVARSRIAFLHSEAGDPESAIRGFEQVVAINPNDGNSWFNLGFLQQQTGNHQAAIVAFAHAVAVNHQLDRAWYGTGLSLMAIGQLHDAILALQKTTALQPMSPFAHMQLARVYYMLGDNDHCEKRMHQLKSFDPKNAALLEDETGINVGVERWWLP